MFLKVSLDVTEALSISGPKGPTMQLLATHEYKKILTLQVGSEMIPSVSKPFASAQGIFSIIKSLKT